MFVLTDVHLLCVISSRLCSTCVSQTVRILKNEHLAKILCVRAAMASRAWQLQRSRHLKQARRPSERPSQVTRSAKWLPVHRESRRLEQLHGPQCFWIWIATVGRTSCKLQLLFFLLRTPKERSLWLLSSS